MKMIEVKNHVFSGYFRADKVTAVWIEEVTASAMARRYGEYKVMIRVDRQDYLYKCFEVESEALAAVDKIREQME